jgi:hypothetical protein
MARGLVAEAPSVEGVTSSFVTITVRPLGGFRNMSSPSPPSSSAACKVTFIDF